MWRTGQSSCLLWSCSPWAALAAGSCAAIPMAPSYLRLMPPRLISKPSTPASQRTAKSRPREPRQKPQSSASATSRAPSKWLRVARRAVALSLLILLSSCALWPVPEATPAPVPVVCPDSAMSDHCPAPMYVLPAGDIPGDVAAAMAIAESRARDACAAQLTALQDCVRAHNGGKRKGQRR